MAEVLSEKPRLLTGVVDDVVWLCRNKGIETPQVAFFTEACGFETAVVSFEGSIADGLSILGAALAEDLPISAVRRSWAIHKGEPQGQRMELVVGPLDDEPRCNSARRRMRERSGCLVG
jgi:hypothetical protein